MLATIRAHWRGELQPATSILLFVFLLSYVFNSAFSAALSVSILRERYPLQLALLTLVMAFSIPVAAWQFIGTWRSFRNIKNLKRPWKQVVSICGCMAVALIATWTVVQLGARFVALYEAIHKVVEAPSRYVIQPSPKGRFCAVFSGEIAWASFQAVEKYLASHPEVTTLEINSSGGSLQEAAKIAKAVKKRRLATYVQGECLSACTLVYSAGHPRFASETAKFGFHRAIASRLTSEAAVEKSNADFATTLRSNGVDDRFVAQAMAIAPPKIWIPGNNDLKVSGFVDYFVKPN